MRKYIFPIGIALIFAIYFILRLSFKETIEFAYDQPKLAGIVLNYLKDGTYLTSQNFTQDTIGGTVAWGPSLVYFFAPFLSISPDPIMASLLVAVFNSISILFILLIGFTFFRPRVAYIGAIFLATQPWWIIFSRMVYQPTPLPTFIAFSVYCLFKTFENPKSFWLAITMFSWGILLQMYLLSFSFILTSIVFVVFVLFKKRIFPFKQFLAGSLLNFIIYLPSVIYYSKNIELFKRFYEVKNMYSVTLSDLFKNFFYVISGGGLDWQLGYAYKTFLYKTGIPEYSFLIVGILIFLVIGYYALFVAKKNIFNMFLLAIFLAPLWAIPFVGVENVLPRYFLYILPALALILAVSVDNLLEKLGNLFYVIVVLVPAFWMFVIVSYFIFIKNYDYPNGFLSHYSDVPYSFTLKSIDWVRSDAKKNRTELFYITTESLAVNYYMDHIDSSNGRNFNGVEYKIMFNDPNSTIHADAKFGPLSVFKSTQLIDGSN